MTMSSLSTGTAQSVGCTVEKSNPHAIIEKIDAGEIEIPEASISI